MNILLDLVLYGALFSCVYCRLVFPKDSDVGYIVSDNDSRNDEEILSSELKERIHHHHDNTVKRASSLPQTDIDSLNEEKEIESSTVDSRIPEKIRDKNHGVVMGVKNKACDNGVDNLETDWKDNKENHTCYTPKHRLKINYDLKPNVIEHHDDVPTRYMSKHICMFDPIYYNDVIPTHGPHRPLWPKWGDYLFVPVQRWIHALEHGAIVMLYHPCTEPTLVNQLKKILSGCIFKHVITPYNKLDPERPLALVAWSYYIQMSYVDEEKVKDFIRKKAKHGPEGHYAKVGNYKYAIINAAVPLEGSDASDTVICPN